MSPAAQRVSVASAERPDAGPASEGALQHPAPSATAFPAEGPSDETEHRRRRGAHRSTRAPKSSAVDASAATAVQLPTRVPFGG